MIMVNTACSNSPKAAARHHAHSVRSLLLIMCMIVVACGILSSIAAALLQTTSKTQLQFYSVHSVPRFSHERDGSDPLAVPQVVIIGTAKAGTTDLWRQLVGKERSESEKKELDKLIVTPRMFPPGSAALDDYMRHLRHPCSNASARLAQKQPLADCMEAAHSRGPNITIDATPLYLEHPEAALMLRAISPRSKIIVMLRDPIERAESLYNHHKIEGGQDYKSNISQMAADFLSWTKADPLVKPLLQRLAATSDPVSTYHLYSELVSRGLLKPRERALFGGALYSYALAAWQAQYFAPGRVLVMHSSVYFRDRGAAMARIVRFVHGRDMTASERALAAGSEITNAKRIVGNVTADSVLDALQRSALATFYAPHNEHLLQVTLPSLKRSGALVIGW